MKISNIETIVVRVPFKHGGPPSGFGGTVWSTLPYLLVKVDTDDGITGWGEAFGYNCIPATKAMIDSVIAPLFIGRDPTQIEPLMAEMFQTLHIFGRYGVTVFGLSGIDIALWDIAGKRAGMPVYQLLGGSNRSDIKAYASLLKYQDPEVTAKVTRDALDEGYEYIKLHECTVAPVRGAREEAGDGVPIMVDVNCLWTPEETIAFANDVAPYDLHWLEEPVWPPENFHGLAEVRMATDTWIAAGENACTAWQFREMFEAEAVTLAQPSVTKVGGITEFRKVQTLAEVYNVGVAPHSPYFGPGFLASMHLIAASRNIASVERLYVELEASMFSAGTDPVAGRIPVPQGPGLGFDPDPDYLKTYRET